jgi:hypothetical protein
MVAHVDIGEDAESLGGMVPFRPLREALRPYPGLR